jgi:hypothetical protein
MRYQTRYGELQLPTLTPHEVPDHCRDLRYPGCYRHAMLPNPGDPRLFFTLATLNDCTGMPHPLVGQGGDTADLMQYRTLVRGVSSSGQMRKTCTGTTRIPGKKPDGTFPTSPALYALPHDRYPENGSKFLHPPVRSFYPGQRHRHSGDLPAHLRKQPAYRR